MERRLAIIACMLVAQGCFLDRSGLGVSSTDAASVDAGPSSDGGGFDAGRRDGGPPPDDAGRLDEGGVDASDARDAGRDAGPPDSGPPDSGPPDSGPPDSGPPDSGPPDSGPPDSGPPDSGPPDAGPPSCDAVYGAATGYILCREPAPNECEFYSLHASTESCQSICMALTGRNSCVRRWRDGDGAGNECVHMDSTARSCATLGNTSDICVCTR